MRLKCGCDPVLTRYFDLCPECRERASIAGGQAIQRDKMQPPERRFGSGGDLTTSGALLRPGR